MALTVTQIKLKKELGPTIINTRQKPLIVLENLGPIDPRIELHHILV